MGFVGGYVKFISKIWPIVILLWTALLDNLIPETPGTASAFANAVFKENFQQSSFAPWLFVVECPATIDNTTQPGLGCHGGNGQTVLNDVTLELFSVVNETLLTRHPEVFINNLTQSYFILNGTDLDKLKTQYISHDGAVTLLVLQSHIDIAQSLRFEAYDTYQQHIEKRVKKLCPNCSYMGLTGVDPLTSDVAVGIEKLLIKTNLFVIPFSAALLLYMVGNWRLLIITLYNIAVVVLGAFAVADWISDLTQRPQSITPQMIEVISIAISIDYSLFMFTRFVKELKTKRQRFSIRRYQFTQFKRLQQQQEQNPMYTQTVLSSPQPQSQPHQRQSPYGAANSDGTFSSSIDALSQYSSSQQRQSGTASSSDPYTDQFYGLPFDQSLDSSSDPFPSATHPSKDIVMSAIIATVEHSGHVVLVSGVTLLLSFGGFVLSRCSFLIQPAMFTALGVLFAILTTLTSTVAFLVGFPSFFSDFNILPSFMYCCCRQRRYTMLFDTDFAGDEIFLEEIDDRYSLRTSPDGTSSSNNNNNNNNNNGYYTSLPNPSLGVNSATLPRHSDSNNTSEYTHLMARNDTQDHQTLLTHSSQSDLQSITQNARSIVNVAKFQASFWYKLGKLTVRFPINMIILFCVFGIMGFFSWHLVHLKLSSAYQLGIPRTSKALDAMSVIQESFPPGILQPMYILMKYTPNYTVDAPGPAFTKTCLDAGHELLETFVNATGIAPNYTSSPLYWDGAYVDTVERATELLLTDDAYKAIWATSVNPYVPTSGPSNQTVVYKLLINSPIEPMSPDIITLIRTIRENVTEPLTQQHQHMDSDHNSTIEYFLSGYKATEEDTVHRNEERFPLMLGITFALVICVVALFLQSAFVPIRLLLTLVLPLGSTFGLAILVYQNGILRWTQLDMFTPELNQIYWELPPFAAVVLLSLALDYDIFLISRIIEHRTNGYTNESSILLALYDTGSIINAAGIIMALTFSGLLFMPSEAVNQLGWILVSSVIIDTFIVRPIIVPCVMSWADSIGWWPRRVPTTNLKNFDGSIEVN